MKNDIEILLKVLFMINFYLYCSFEDHPEKTDEKTDEKKAKKEK